MPHEWVQNQQWKRYKNAKFAESLLLRHQDNKKLCGFDVIIAFLNIFALCSSVSIVDCGHVNTGQDAV